MLLIKMLLLLAFAYNPTPYAKRGDEPAVRIENPADCARVTVNGRTVSNSACRGRKP